LFKKLFNDQKGSTIVEISIILPLLFGILIFSIYLIEITRSDTMMEVATAEAAREYSITGDEALAVNKARQIIDNSVTLIGGNKPRVWFEDGAIFSERYIYNMKIGGIQINSFKIKQGSECAKEPDTIYYNKPNAPGTTGNPHKY